MSEYVPPLDIHHFRFHGLKVFVYPTSRAAVEAFWHSEGLEWREKRHFTDGQKWSADEDGEECLNAIRGNGRWAFVAGKEELHLWYRRNTNVAELVSMLAHEYGHLSRPFSQSAEREEAKAARYGQVAFTALALMGELTTRGLL